ncbi:MAG: hypothetical protein M3463_20375, partial [Verrucomicrobiota bacterium]|nr:hypothetical protein [Verrucomicrobiota bacterium]
MRIFLPVPLLFAAAALAGPFDDPKRPVARGESLPAEVAAGKMRLPAGFSVQVVAHEPDVVQP